MGELRDMRLIGLISCLFSLSLRAMELELRLEVNPCPDPCPLILVGDKDTEALPLQEAVFFPVLKKRLMQAGFRKTLSGARIYGEDGTIFSDEEKDALSVLVNVRRSLLSMPYPLCYYPQKSSLASLSQQRIPLDYKRGLISQEALWNIAYYAYQWKEIKPQLATNEVMNYVLAKMPMQHPIPDGYFWIYEGSWYAKWIRPHKKDISYINMMYDGRVVVHNHRPDSSYEHESSESETFLKSYKDRYLVEDHSNNSMAFTQEDFQKFCNNKAVKNVIPQEDETLHVIFADNTLMPVGMSNKNGIAQNHEASFMTFDDDMHLCSSISDEIETQ